MSESTLYREHWTESGEFPDPIPDGWIYAGHDNEFGVLTRWMVPVEPDKVVTTRYENMFGPCDFIDRIDVAEPGTYAIIRIGGDDE